VAVKLGYNNTFRSPKGYPEWEKMGLPILRTPAGLDPTSPKSQGPGPLHGWAMIWTLLGIFVGGMALNLTPCIYPLIPITVSYFGGRSQKSKGVVIGHGLCYVMGLSLTNSILGVMAALTGGLMGTLLQNPVVLGLVAGILVFFAASLFGFWELRLPHGLTQAASKSYAGYFGSLFMGLTLGIVAAPCIGPFVLGLLTWVAGIGSPWLGFVVFFTLSLGLGVPLFILAFFSGQLDRLPRSGEWMLWVRKLMGWVLIGMAAYFIRPILPKPMDVFLMAIIAVSGGLHLGWIDPSRAGFRFFEWIRTGAGLAGLIIATFLMGSWLIQGPSVEWKPYSDQLLTAAKRLKKPVIMDFYAGWCSPCRKLDEMTFHDPEVVKQATSDFIMIKVDLTRKGSSVHGHLLQHYGIKGVPTVVFLERYGTERRDLRLVDYLPPDQFLIRMFELKKSQGNTNG